MDPTKIPIINYHKIGRDADIGITCRHPERFRRDLQQLLTGGYESVTFSDLANDRPLPPKPVIITFDDGYASVFSEALPIMQETGFTGVVYLPVNYIGKDNNWDVQFGGKVYRHLSADQILMLQENGFEIGSHGMSHRMLLHLDDRHLEYELAESRDMLEKLTGQTVVSVSYPFGRFNRRVVQSAREVGYRYAVGSVYFKPRRDDRELTLRRFNIYRYDSDRTFMRKAASAFVSFTGIRDWLIQKGGLATAVYQDLFLKEKTAVPVLTGQENPGE